MRTTKKLISFALILALVCSLLPQLRLIAHAESDSGFCGADGDNLSWSFDENSGVLRIEGSGAMEHFESQAPWYEFQDKITAVQLPEGLENIGNHAFEDCFRLSYVAIPENVVEINDHAFQHCNHLQYVTLPARLSYIGNMAFADTGLRQITLPEWTWRVDNYAFEDCRSMRCAVFSGNVSSIGVMVFSSCGENLDDFTIYAPEGSVAQSYAEANGIHFAELAQAPVAPRFDVYGHCGVDDNLFWGIDLSSGALYIDGTGAMEDFERDENQAPWFEYRQSITQVVLEEGISYIGAHAFEECEALCELTLPASLQTIGMAAFEKCEALYELTLPASLQTIGMAAFYGCVSLTNLTLPDSVQEIGDLAFSNCEALTSISFPDSVQIIGNSAFEHCTSLTDVTIPDSVTNVGSAFYNCTGLERASIGSGVSALDDYVFYGCTALREIHVSPENQNYRSQDGVLFDQREGALMQYPVAKQDSNYLIPDDVTRINDHAFSGCTALQSVAIGRNVTSIGNYAFYACNNLAEISIPDSVNQICDRAFESTEYYWNAANWKNGLLCNGQWLIAGRNIQDLEIPEGITKLADDAFSSSNSLQSVIIPDSVSILGNGTFKHCNKLTQVSIGSGVTRIGRYTFSDCSALCRVTIPETVNEIDSGAFARCDSLASIFIQNPDCEIYSWYLTLGNRSKTHICGAEGSTAEAYAQEYGYAFGHNYVAKVPTATDTGCTTYTCSFCGDSYCIPSVSKPVITAQPASVSAALGTPVSFTVEAEGENLRYQWQYKKAGASTWTKWSGKTSASLSFKAVASSNGCQYRCIVTNGAGSSNSETATLTILSKPVITSQPASVSAAPGKTVTFTVAAEGENLCYQWQYKKTGASTWTKWNGKTSASLSFKAVAGSNGCQYRCIVTNEAGSVNSEAATLSVLSKPVIISQPASVSAARGEAVSFTVEAEGENLRYQWQYKKAGSSTWNNWIGKTSASLSFKAVASSNGCQYRCVVSNDAGSVSSKAATLTVKDA